MADQSKPLRATCVVGGETVDCFHSLRLTKDNGVWKTNPVCPACRSKLIRQAKSDGIFIPFFSLETSNAEALKRNSEAKRLGSFVSQYGRKPESKEKPFNKARLKTSITSGNLMIAG
jgi:hypothetical protein